MRKHGGPPSRRDKHVTLAAISPPGVARGRFVGGQQSGLAGCKPPPLFTRGASSCSSQGRRQGEPWGASPRPSAPTYLPTSLLLAYLWLGLSWIDCLSANKSFSSPKTSSRKPYTSSKQQERHKDSVEITINFSRTRGALMLGPQREPGWVRAPGSSYSKGIGSVASSLPLAGLDEGSILEFFKLTSVWSETAHFQLPTPRG